MFRKLQPSRTFALALTGLAILLVAVLVDLVVVLAELGAHGSADAQILGDALATLQVLAACVATVATGGAGSMALRDFGSKGATSSQAIRKPPTAELPQGEEGP